MRSWCYFPLDYENQGLGKTKGARNTKIHAITNAKVQALNFILTSGNKHEIIVAFDLLKYGKDRIVLRDIKIMIQTNFEKKLIKLEALLRLLGS